MSVPELVNALCHHLATQYERDGLNFNSTKTTVRETLYKRYKDVAFSELLGLGASSRRRRGSGWESLPAVARRDDADRIEADRGRSRSRSRSGSSRTVERLREMLISPMAERRARRLKAAGSAGPTAGSMVVVETDDGFVFQCSEGENVFRFLAKLATTWPEDDDEEVQARREARSAHVGRGALLDDAPNPNFVPGLESIWDSSDASGVGYRGDDGVRGRGRDGNRRDGGGTIVPAPRGWFDANRGPPGSRQRATATQTTQNTLTTTPTTTSTATPRTELASGKPFAYQPSRSPVKVPIGSLFMDRSPGKMTSFDARIGLEDSPRKLRRRREDARRGVLDSLKRLDVGNASGSLFRDGALSIVDNAGKGDRDRDISEGSRVCKETTSLWNGEESEIAREALMALGGVRSSLSKLRGRLLMPLALPRPASVHILSSMVEASVARYLVEDFVDPILKERDTERARDPVSNALAHGLKRVLEDIDKDLVRVEMEEVNSWMQPIGLKMREGVEVRGAEYHGLGMSILQLEHATAKARRSLLFLASYLDARGGSEDEEDVDDEDDDDDDDERGTGGFNIPRGVALLERLHQAAQYSLEGEQAEIAKRLFLGSLAPYLSLISRWAFGIEDLTDADPFTAPLSSEYAIGTSALRETLGPASVPSFFPAETRRDLIVSGTQLRLLYSWWREDEDGFALGEALGNDVSSFFVDAGRGKPEQPWCRDEASGDEMEDNELSEPDELNERGGLRNDERERWFATGRRPPGIMDTREDEGGGGLGATAAMMDVAFDAEPTTASLGVQTAPVVPTTASKPPPPPNGALSAAALNRRALLERTLEAEAEHVSVSVLLESAVGGLLRRQAALVSSACVRLFVDQHRLNTLDVVRFLRNTLMGFAGDFTSELVRAMDASILTLEPMTAHKARTAVFTALTNSCLTGSPYAGHLTASLLPKGENAVALVEDAFSYGAEDSDAVRIKAPYMSSMAPMLVPPVGHDACDCIHVSFVAPGLLAAIVSEDTLVAYSAIFSMNVRLRRAMLALEAVQRATMMGRREKMECVRGDFELPWAERFKTFRAFCFSCSSHLNAVARMHRACCSGSAWEALRGALEAGAERAGAVVVAETNDIHTLIQFHKRFVYRAASRITSSCNSPAVKLGLETMFDAVLDLRSALDNPARGVGDRSAQRIFEDPSHWQAIKRAMLAYDRGRVGALKARARSRESRIALTETESILSELLSELLLVSEEGS